MYEAQRDTAILRVVAENEFVSVRALTQKLAISEATIRRDLRRLSEAGRLRRVRGGAQRIARPGLVGQPGFETDQAQNADAKRAIAREAAALCEQGDAVILDGGTTVYAMTEFLQGLGLLVLTPSLPVAQTLAVTSDATITLSGGEVFREQQIVASPYPQPIVEGFYARFIFLSAQAISSRGLMQTDSLLIGTELALISRAEQVVALVDSSKFGARANLVACPLSRIGVVITDSGVTPRHRQMVESAGIRLIVAEPKQT